MKKLGFLIIAIFLAGCEFSGYNELDQNDEPLYYTPTIPDLNAQYYGVWVAEGDDNTKKEIEITKDSFTQRCYASDLLQTESTYLYKRGYLGSGYFELVIPVSVSLDFEMRDNELMFGGGDIIYSRNSGLNNEIAGEWEYRSEDYTLLLTFAPLGDTNEGTMNIYITISGGWFGNNATYEIKNNQLIMSNTGLSGLCSKLIKFDKNKLYLTNRLITNNQIKKFNDAHKDDAIRNEMFGLFYGFSHYGSRDFIDASKIRDYSAEEYIKQ